APRRADPAQPDGALDGDDAPARRRGRGRLRRALRGGAGLRPLDAAGRGDAAREPPRRARRAAAPARARLRRARRGPAACRGAGALASGARRRLSTVVPGVRGPAAARAGSAGAVAPRAATLPRMTPPPGPILELLVSTQPGGGPQRSEEHTSELQSRFDLVCRLLLEKKNSNFAS